MQLQEDRPLHKTTEDPLDNIDLGSVSRKGHANLASSLWSKAATIFVRFDIEIVIGILIIIFFCTVFSIFTRVSRDTEPVTCYVPVSIYT